MGKVNLKMTRRLAIRIELDRVNKIKRLEIEDKVSLLNILYYLGEVKDGQ